MVQQRVLETAKGRFLFRVTQPARNFLLREGTDLKYGARHLKRAIERYVVYPLASLLATEQVCLGDVISIDWDNTDGNLMFLKHAEGAIVPMNTPAADVGAGTSAATSDGRELSFPAPTTAVAKAERDRKVSHPVSAQRGIQAEKAREDKR